MSKVLFEGDSDPEPEFGRLRTNEGYAKSYNKFRQKELLKKFKDREKNKASESSTEEDSESSEDELVADKRFDEEFYKTLALLKSKNPKIYSKETKFFNNLEEKDDSKNSEKIKKQKAMTVRDYERKVILERGGKFEDESDNDFGAEVNNRSAGPSYIEEQKKLKSEIKKVLDSDDNNEEEFGGIFRKREKSKEERLQEDEEFASWLAGKKDKIDDNKAESLNPLKEYWTNPNLNKQEQFLRDYILNNGYENRDTYDIPTYEEVIADCSEDEKELEKQDEFEHKYNFRFEEPDQDFIKRYPRTIDVYIRKKDEKRKEKRLEVKERKLKEKEQKFKELQILKEIKRKEIQEKIQKLKEVTGNEELPFKEEELDEDFDPEAHDRRMQEIFNEQYYEVDEDEEKPECPEIEDLKVEDWDNFDPKKEDGGIDDDYEPHCEDEDFNMDCDYDPHAAKEELQNELIANTKSKRKRGRRNKFMEMIKREKPAFDPNDEKTYSEYIDEYYKMDCEDIIGDIPCRFKYVETEPNDFGLTVEEILLAKNKELNQWVSLKKAIQIRPKQAEIRDRKLYRMKSKNENLKRKIFTSIYGPPSEDEDDELLSKKKDRPNESGKTEQSTETGKTKKKKKKKKKKSPADAGITNNSITAENGHDETSNGSKKDNKEEISKILDITKDEQKEVNTVTTNMGESSSQNKKKKKKKKNKQNENGNTDKSENGNTDKSETENKNHSSVAQNEKETSQKRLKKPEKIDKTIRDKTKHKDFSKRKLHNPKKLTTGDSFLDKLSDERLRAYGFNPRKFRKEMNFEYRKNAQSKNVKQKKGDVSHKKNKFKKKLKEANSA